MAGRFHSIISNILPCFPLDSWNTRSDSVRIVGGVVVESFSCKTGQTKRCTPWLLTITGNCVHPKAGADRKKSVLHWESNICFTEVKRGEHALWVATLPYPTTEKGENVGCITSEITGLKLYLVKPTPLFHERNGHFIWLITATDCCHHHIWAATDLVSSVSTNVKYLREKALHLDIKTVFCRHFHNS